MAPRRPPISGTAVLEYGATEILPPVGSILKHPARLCRPGRQASRAQPRGKPGFPTLDSSSGRETDSPLQERGFELSVPLAIHPPTGRPYGGEQHTDIEH